MRKAWEIHRWTVGARASWRGRFGNGCPSASGALPSSMPRAPRSRHARANKRRQGLKLVRLWLPDPKSASFRRRIRQQCVALRGLPEDREALAFIEAVNEEENWR